MARLALATAGAVIGFVVGGGPLGAAVGFSLGAAIGGFIFQDQPEDQIVRGPRQEDLSVQVSTYGNPIPFGYGVNREAGNVIWTSGIREEKIVSESDVGGKGLGGATVTSISYLYYASWATAFGEGVGADVLRIWADAKLRVSKISTDVVESETGFDYIFYPGTETQLPDPLMEAWFDENIAVGAAPAYRGLIYIVFDDILLTDYGNRIPIINAQIARKSAATFPTTLIPSLTTFPNKVEQGYLYDANRDLAYMLTGSQGEELTIVKIDLSNPNPPLAQVDIGFNMNDGDGGAPAHLDKEGFLYLIKNVDNSISKIDPLTLKEIANSGSLGAGAGGVVITVRAVDFIIPGIETKKFLVVCQNSGQIKILLRESLQPFSLIPLTDLPSIGFSVTQDFDQDFWVLCTATDILRRYRFSIGVTGLITITYKDFDISADIPTGKWVGYLFKRHALIMATPGGNDNILVEDGGEGFIIWDIATEARIDQFSTLEFGFDLCTGDSPKYLLQSDVVGISEKWYAEDPDDHLNVIDLDTRAVETYDANDFATGTGNLAPWMIDPRRNGWLASWTVSGLEQNIIMYFNKADREGEDLDVIVKDVLNRSGLADSQLDVTDLVGIKVPGYSIARQSNGSEILAPLSIGYQFDMFETDFIIKSKLRGSASILTIPDDDLGVSVEGEPVKVEINRIKESTIPMRVDVSFIDPERDYQQQDQHSKRIIQPVETTRSRQVKSVTVPYALEAGDAKNLSLRLLMQAWVSRLLFKFKLSAKHILLNPADVIQIVRGGETLNIRITKQSIGANFALELQGVQEDATIYGAVDTEALALGFPDQAISVIRATELFLFDISLLRDQDDTNPTANVLYIIAASTSPDWRGAAIYVSSDGEEWEQLTTAVNNPVWGATTNALSDEQRWTVFNRTEVLNVRLVDSSAQLSSVTEAQALDGANAALVGDEIIIFQNAVQQGDGTWNLTNLLRGRRGTVTAIPDHNIGDRFFLLSTSTVQKTNPPLSDLSAVRFYKAVSLGASLEDAVTHSLTLEGGALKPYQVVHLESTRLTGPDELVVRWIRQTRTGADLNYNDGIDEVPLAQTEEKYEAVLLDKITGEEVASTLKVVTTANSELIIYIGVTPNADLVNNGDRTATVSGASIPIPDYTIFQVGAWLKLIDFDQLGAKPGFARILATTVNDMLIDLPDIVTDTHNQGVTFHQLPTYAIFSSTDLTNAGYSFGDLVSVRVYQMSSVVGRGYPAEATLLSS